MITKEEGLMFMHKYVRITTTKLKFSERGRVKAVSDNNLILDQSNKDEQRPDDVGLFALNDILTISVIGGDTEYYQREKASKNG